MQKAEQVTCEYLNVFGQSRNHKILSREEERELLLKKGTDEWKEAREQLTMCNLRLVYSIAKPYKKSAPGEFEDVLMHGVIGLIQAIERFEISANTRLSTYATWYIRQEIQTGFINKNELIHVPAYMKTRVNQVCKAKKNLYNHGIAQDRQLLANHSGLTLGEMEGAERAMSIETVSLSTPVGDDKDSELGDFLAVKEPFEEKTIERLSIEEALQKLTPKERRVIEMRFGFNTGIPATLTECGNVMGYTPEWVRKTQNKTIEKLKQSLA